MTTAPTLDVERLAEAWRNHRIGYHGTTRGGCATQCSPLLAAEYERLGKEQAMTTEPRNEAQQVVRGLDIAFQWIAKEYPKALVAMPTEYFRAFELARTYFERAAPALDVERLAVGLRDHRHGNVPVCGAGCAEIIAAEYERLGKERS